MASTKNIVTGTYRVAFCTVGCRVNQCETAEMQAALAKDGFCPVDWNQSADVRVINTCAVTARSEHDCRRQIRQAKRLDPDCLVVVVGCYAQINSDVLAAMPEVDLVLGNIDKFRLSEHLAKKLAPGKQSGGEESRRDKLVSVTPYSERQLFESEEFACISGHTRAFLRIQTGCNSRCSYCVVPYARGPARSMSREEVIRRVEFLTASGYREVVLTGIDLGSWGKDSGDGHLSDLLLDLLRCTSVERLRLSSVEPLEVTESLLAAIESAGERVAHHFHVPLQSGADVVLARMNRPYRATEYLAIVQQIAARFPDAAIGADVIVGFPGETEEQFAETLALVKESPLTYLHVFAYSDRPGTAAATMHPKIPPEIIQERSKRLRQLGESKRVEFRRRQLGSIQK
ncbi:MAG: tRNA (N(6)-L-threonylcarbamoyladenosine(37)-C(2))-methylthiotransferase MtaB, partial [Anaerolineae bacterium]